MAVGNATNHNLNGLTVEGDLNLNQAATANVVNLRAGAGSELLVGEAPYWRDQYILNGASRNVHTSVPRATSSMTSVAMAGSGVMLVTALALYAGDVITSVTLKIGTTGSTGLTNGWAALYDTSNNLMAQSTDRGAVEVVANTVTTFTLTAAQTIPSTGLYRIGLMVTVGTTMPTLLGLSLGTTSMSSGIGTVPTLVGSNSTSLAATAPASCAPISATANVPYFVTA